MDFERYRRVRCDTCGTEEYVKFSAGRINFVSYRCNMCRFGKPKSIKKHDQSTRRSAKPYVTYVNNDNCPCSNCKK